jgi:Protein of unknown function (DUF3224)
MTTHFQIGIRVLLGACLCLAGVSAHAQAGSTTSTANNTEVKVAHATGTFEVKMAPQKWEDAPGASLARMSFDKQWHGDFEGTSKGEMMTAGTDVKNSAGYVALEVVTGTLKGRTGAFIFQHNATMDRGTPHLSIAVVPDSGTGQLAGLTGTLNIVITDGKHSYDFEYSLPETH